MRIVVTGASGLLGLTLCRSWRDQHDVIGLTRDRALDVPGVRFEYRDLLAQRDLAPVLAPLGPDLIVHCAAMTNVDACEQDENAAHRLNGEVPGRVAQWCASQAVRLVHVSTDAVFDGVDGNYDEQALPNPVNAYARSKLAGELAVSVASPGALIARINLFGWSRTGSRSLVEFFINRFATGESAGGFTDVRFSPLLANHLAQLLLQAGCGTIHGVRHFASRDGISKYDFGRMTAEIFGFNPDLVIPTVSDDVGFSAARPKNLTLDASCVAEELGLVLPTVGEGVRDLRHLEQTGYRQEITA
jgi:dTDP-4-dehydrorhamnose reductase